MTGFGRGTARSDALEITVELRAVNHRYLDLSFRLPRSMQYLEPRLRSAAQKALARGHVDITLSDRRLTPPARQVRADIPLVTAYANAAREMEKAAGIKGRLKLQHLLALPEVFLVEEPGEDEEALATLAVSAMGDALRALNAAREQEGEATRADLSLHLGELEALHLEMAALAPQQLADYPARLEARVQAMQAEGLDSQRLHQEVALMADRVAVDEELARLKAHIEGMRGQIAGGGPHGRSLDFLVQEMAREVNTIASKACLLALTQHALKAKNCVEKLREQVQNLE